MRKISVSIAMLALTAGYVTPASARLHNSPWFERFADTGSSIHLHHLLPLL